MPIDCSEMIICMVSWSEVWVPTHIMNRPLICYQEILKFYLFGSARLLLESRLEYIIPKYENLLMDDFLAYLADTVESRFIKNLILMGLCWTQLC